MRKIITNTAPIIGRKIRLALVGCGRISAKHFDAVDKHSDRIELISVCDNDPNRLEKAVKRTAVKGFEHMDD
ncbi:MAG TPA: Gfo/Idh/MocA family oxidoreductase, partial [Gammaproteobacteria bacterium]|nr:Gfo/Idh/MocA family oxidoreductase [Gammaproteobacteria bacterium]